MYKSLLMFRYLRKRRIAWVSLIAVTLCTALMITVISVMGGWLRMFRQSFHGLTGDVMVMANSPMTGFDNYQEMVDQIELLPAVGKGNAVPVIGTFGILNVQNSSAKGVQVLAYQMDKIGNVNDFPKSLYRQHAAREEAAVRLKDPNLKLNAAERAYYQSVANDKSPASFDLVKEVAIPVRSFPADLVIPAEFADRMIYLSDQEIVVWRGVMTKDEFEKLQALSSNSAYQTALSWIYQLSDFRRASRVKSEDVDPSKWPGIILGDGVAQIRKDMDGKISGRDPTLFRVPVKLTVVSAPLDGGTLELDNRSVENYWVVDDSRTKVYQYDSQTVYVDFHVLQKALGMTEKKAEDGAIISPARATEIDIRVKTGFDLVTVRNQVERICDRISESKFKTTRFGRYGDYHVQTWEDSNRVFLSAIENEKVLVMFLFGLISIVAVFLIFCIFYMIVVEKTRDIGIIKSVGATNKGVAGIFLGYGLVIGIIGAGMGFLIAWQIVTRINDIHSWLGHPHKWFGKEWSIVIWNPQVYAFDSIPNTIDIKEALVIVAVAMASALLGATLPAIRAARLHPIEALRWE